MAQMKELSKTPERELSDEEIANLSDVEFKTLVTKMLTELTELGHKIKEQMKATQSEKNIHGINSDRKETRSQSNDLEQKEEINIQVEQKEFKKMKRDFWTFDNLKRSNIRIIGVPEGEGQQQEIEHLFEQIMKENFPNPAKEIDFQ